MCIITSCGPFPIVLVLPKFDDELQGRQGECYRVYVYNTRVFRLCTSRLLKWHGWVLICTRRNRFDPQPGKWLFAFFFSPAISFINDFTEYYYIILTAVRHEVNILDNSVVVYELGWVIKHAFYYLFEGLT